MQTPDSPFPEGPPPVRRPRPLWKRLRDRLPVRVRQNYRLLTVAAVFLVVLGTVFAGVQITPLVTSASDAEAEITEDIEGTVDLFDLTQAHSITITYNQTDYDKMMSEYQSDGTKEYVDADITIDGTLIQDVGIRLKGNSTLSGLRQSSMGGGDGEAPGGGGGAPGGMGQQDGAAVPSASATTSPSATASGASDTSGATVEDVVDETSSDTSTAAASGDASASASPSASAGAGGMQMGGGGGGMSSSSLSADEPENLPWLIRIDEFVEGRRYQGHRDISIRPVLTSSGYASGIAEGLALGLTAASGEPSEQFVESSFTINDRPTTTRFVLQVPDDGYTSDLGNGVLYKSTASSDFSYQGEDQTEYEDDFVQVNKVGSQDYQPLIDFIKWANECTDEEFEEDLDDWMDVDSFANYLALQNLLLNQDSMDGPGRNYYLWYDLDTEKFSVVSWDLNMTLGSDTSLDPEEESSMGGGGGGMMGGFGGGTDAAAGGDAAATPSASATGQASASASAGAMPGAAGAMPGAAGAMPGAATDGTASASASASASGTASAQAGQGWGGQGRGGQDWGGQAPDMAAMGDGDDGATAAGGGGGMSTDQILITRFRDSTALMEKYDEAYQRMYLAVFADGKAQDLLDELKTSWSLVDGIDTADLESDYEYLTSFIQARTSYLETTDLIQEALGTSGSTASASASTSSDTATPSASDGATASTDASDDVADGAVPSGMPTGAPTGGMAGGMPGGMPGAQASSTDGDGTGG